MINTELAQEALDFIDSVAAKAAGDRNSHENVKRATSTLAEFIKQSVPVEASSAQ